MNILNNYIPEIILAFSAVIIFTLNILINPFSKRKIFYSLTIFIIGIVLATLAQVSASYKDIDLTFIFKCYFSISAIIFIFTYSKKFHAAEHLAIIGIILSAFLILSSRAPIITFSSMTMFMLCTYSFMLTRERLISQEGLFLVTATIILILLYKVSPLLSSSSLIVLSTIYFIKTRNKDIEALIIFFVTPILTYLLIRCFAGAESSYMTTLTSLMSFTLLIISSVLILFTKKEHDEKRATKYGLFYLGNILLFIGMGTKDSIALSIILTILIPFTYSHRLTLLSVANMGMLPITPSFIAKYLFSSLLIKAGAWIESSVLLIASLIFWVSGAYDICDNFRNKTRSKVLSLLSILVLLSVAIFFNSFHNMLKISIESILRTN